MKSKRNICFVLLLIIGLIIVIVTSIMRMSFSEKTEFDFKNTNTTISEFVPILKKENFEISDEIQGEHNSNRFHIEAQKESICIEIVYDKDKLIDFLL